MQSWADSTKAVLAETYAGKFEVWYVQKYPKGVTWCARRVGEATACVNVDRPEELVKLLGEMVCQCPRHSHYRETGESDHTAAVIPLMRKYGG